MFSFTNQEKERFLFLVILCNDHNSYREYAHNLYIAQIFTGGLAWLQEIDIPLRAELFDLAINYGHTEIVKWLHENNCSWYLDIVMQAEIENRLEIADWLRSKGYPLRLS